MGNKVTPMVKNVFVRGQKDTSTNQACLQLSPENNNKNNHSISIKPKNNHSASKFNKPKRSKKREKLRIVVNFLAQGSNFSKMHTDNLLDIIGQFYDAQAIYCRYINCCRLRPIPLKPRRRDALDGQFTVGLTYDMTYIEIYGYKYEDQYLPVFNENRKFKGYTCHEHFKTEDDLVYLRELGGFGNYKTLGVEHGQLVETARGENKCDRCRTIRSEDELNRCYFCTQQTCKVRCTKKYQYMQNKNVNIGGIWRRFQAEPRDPIYGNVCITRQICDVCFSQGKDATVLRKALSIEFNEENIRMMKIHQN